MKKKMMLIEEMDAVKFGAAVNAALAEYPNAQPSFPAEGVAYIVYDEFDEEGRLASLERRYRVLSDTPIADEFEREGIRFLCENCPYLEVGADKRRKMWPCKYSEYGMSKTTSGCCEFFYKQLKQGKVQPVEEESND